MLWCLPWGEYNLLPLSYCILSLPSLNEPSLIMLLILLNLSHVTCVHNTKKCDAKRFACCQPGNAVAILQTFTSLGDIWRMRYFSLSKRFHREWFFLPKQKLLNDWLTDSCCDVGSENHSWKTVVTQRIKEPTCKLLNFKNWWNRKSILCMCFAFVSSVVSVAPSKDVYLLKYADFGVSTFTFSLNLNSISDCGFSNQVLLWIWSPTE